MIERLHVDFNARIRRFSVLMTVFILFTGLSVIAQTRVTGKVTGTNGEVVTGASVTVKGTSQGTLTDGKGQYSIPVTDKNTVLVFSSIGYSQVEQPVNGQASININLAFAAASQESVVVIGYGTASKRDLTGSIVKISGKEVADKPNSNPIASLQSKVAGLSVVNNGTPGASPDIRIRGTASIGQPHPLYVVDGIFEDNIDYLNPNDIESIEVLKDPSSLAIFGVRGATGVIAISTKQARAGQLVVSFNTNYGFKKLVDKIKVVDANGFKTLFAEENANNGVTTPDYSALNANTDWIKAVTRTGQFNNNNLTVQSGTEKNKINFSLGYLTDQGLIRHEQLNRMTIGLNDELRISKNIRIGASITATRQNDPYDATGVLNQARQVMPQVSATAKPFRVVNPYNSADTSTRNIYSGLDVALQSAGVINPILQLENTWNKVKKIEYRQVGSVYVEVNFLKNFTFRSTAYLDMSTVNSRNYSPLYYAYNPLDNTPYLYGSTTSVSEYDDSYRKAQTDNIITYKKTFGDHSLTATGGFTTYYFGHTGRSAVAKQFTGANSAPIPDDPRLWYITNGIADPNNTLATSSQNEYSTVSGLGRLLYNYKGRYYLNASYRVDASSQLPPKNRTQPFWAVGAAWDLSKESFMTNQNIFSFLKLKGSFGVLGNQTSSYLDGSSINYPFYPVLQTGTTAVFGTNIFSAARLQFEKNPDLKWESIHASEAGVELNAFSNRLHFEGNYFSRRTENLMTYVDRSVLGLSNRLENDGSIRNWGEEFSASWAQSISRDVTLNIGGNITFLKTKVISVAADVPNGILDITQANNGEAISEFKAGMPVGYYKGYVVEGVFQSYADILKSPSQASLGSIRPGDLKYKDVNGDGVVNASDRTFIGNPTPKFTYGVNLNLTYKRFNISTDLSGVYGNQIYRLWGALESPFQRVNYPAFALDRWHGEGTSNWVPIISQADRSNYSGSTYSIEDGSYFRIRNIQLGYNISTGFLPAFKSMRVFANVQNLKTFKNNSGYSPEFGGNAVAFGYDYGGGAIPMVTTFGLNLTF